MTHYLVTHVVNKGQGFREDIVVGKLDKEDFEKWHSVRRERFNYVTIDGLSCVNIFHHLRCDSEEEREWLVSKGLMNQLIA